MTKYVVKLNNYNPPAKPVGSSRQEYASQCKTLAKKASKEVEEIIISLGGRVIGRSWLIGLLLIEIDGACIPYIKAHPDVEACDPPSEIVLE